MHVGGAAHYACREERCGRRLYGECSVHCGIGGKTQMQRVLCEQACRYRYHKSCCKRRSKYGHQDKCYCTVGTVSCALRKLCRCFFGMPDPRWCVQSACNHQPCRPIPFLGSLCLSTSCSRSCFVLSLLFVKQCQSQCVARGFVDTPLMHAHDEKMGSKLPYEVVLGRRAKPEEVAK
jgi:hypothetical protein